MDVYTDQTYENTMVKLDEAAYYRCRFSQCHLLYAGGETLLQDCQLENCNVQLIGPAARTANMLPEMNHLSTPMSAHKRD